MTRLPQRAEQIRRASCHSGLAKQQNKPEIAAMFDRHALTKQYDSGAFGASLQGLSAAVSTVSALSNMVACHSRGSTVHPVDIVIIRQELERVEKAAGSLREVLAAHGPKLMQAAE